MHGGSAVLGIRQNGGGAGAGAGLTDRAVVYTIGGVNSGSITEDDPPHKVKGPHLKNAVGWSFPDPAAAARGCGRGSGLWGRSQLT